MNFSIDSEIKSLCPNATLGILTYSVTVEKTSDSLLDKFNSIISELENRDNIKDFIDNTLDEYNFMNYILNNLL